MRVWAGTCPHGAKKRHAAARTRVRSHADNQDAPGSVIVRNKTHASQICTQHIMETAHSCSYECMRTRRQARQSRLHRRRGAAAHAAPSYVRSTSWRQHTAARMRVCAHGDKQASPGCIVVKEQLHMLLPVMYEAHPGDSTQLLVSVYTHTATSKPVQAASS